MLNKNKFREKQKTTGAEVKMWNKSSQLKTGTNSYDLNKISFFEQPYI